MADQETQNEPEEPRNDDQVVEGGSSIGITRKDESRTEESESKAISSPEETKKTRIGGFFSEENERILSRRRVSLWAGRKKECRENFPPTYSLLNGIEEEGKPISGDLDLEAKSTDDGDQNELEKPRNDDQVVEGGSSIGIMRNDESRTEESVSKEISSSEETKKTQIGGLVSEEKEGILSMRRVSLWTGRKKECKENFPLTYSLLYGIEVEGKPISCDLEAKSTNDGDRKEEGKGDQVSNSGSGGIQIDQAVGEQFKDNFPLAYSLPRGIEEKGKLILYDLEAKNTDDGDRIKKGKGDQVSSSRIGGFQIDQAVGMHFDSLNMEGLSDKDVAHFRTYKDPVTRGNLSEEELKECEKGARRVEAVMKKWDGYGLCEGLAELGPDREELNEVVKEINKYYSENSIVAASVEVVAQLEGKLRWLKEENARLISQRSILHRKWRQEYNFRLYLCKLKVHSLRLGQPEELKRRAELLKTMMRKLDLYEETATEDVVKSWCVTQLIAMDEWDKLWDLERELALRMEGLARPEDREGNAEQELEYLRVQQAWSELEQSYMKLESDLSGLMESREQMVKELRKSRMEVQLLENELKEKNKVVKQLKGEFLKRRIGQPSGKLDG